MKNHKEQFSFNVSTWVSYDLKKRLYEIAERENTNISDIARRFLEKGVSEYKEENKDGN